jgi:hypothetical protein
MSSDDPPGLALFFGLGVIAISTAVAGAGVNVV